MIDGLKKKFILVTMSFVSIILIVVFSVLCYSDYSRMEREIDQSLDRTLHMEMEQKKVYIAPEMMEFRLERQAALLDGSDYDGEFSLAPRQQNPLA